MANIIDKVASDFGGNIFAFLGLIVIGGLAVMQIVSFVITQIFKSVPQLKLGPAFILMVVTVNIMYAFITSFKSGLKFGEILSVSAVMGGVIILVVVFLPKLVPQIFDAASFLSYKTVAMSALGMG